MELPFLEITGAEYVTGYKMKVFFNNGECRIFDFDSVIEKYPAFAPLKDVDLLKSFSITDTLEWRDGTIDIAPEYIYDNGAKPYENAEIDIPVAAEDIGRIA